MFDTLNELSHWFLDRKWSVHISTDITNDGRFNNQYVTTAKNNYRNGELVEDIEDIRRVVIRHPVLDTVQAFSHVKTVIDLHEEVTKFETELPVMCSETVSEMDELVTRMVSEGWLWGFQVSNRGSKKPYYHLSLSTWHWNGYSMGGRVSFSRISYLEDNNLLGVAHSLADVARRAQEEFVESVPYENIHGELKIDTLRTRMMFSKER